ncbi:Protein of unknown function (PD694200) [Arabidopsis thaliana]|uniref:Putative defensin-like protein 89 n=1 Tax=Arabidopsis thaliana TaxID=3702 RepID=DEF89_ARATH|nr:Protein of unknown function (PD694200) [Arabidopsis thaliana]Q2V3J0.1 RecName: Full=Putative defensin-like protein 89; Flags: Precursor [Arabidopsis thaliana]AEE83353.1 Protein of unknown function (PD694200) [Arabidopsis thaliana]|eukprot:NP_001031630.1 Protein of unknown function (PD694200) [Arabidopsis thaliana]
MGFKNNLSLVSVMVFALILLPMISGQTMQCYSGIACTDDGTCNDYCNPRNNNLGGVCLRRANCCCCYVSVVKSQESSLSKDTNNVFITN